MKVVISSNGIFICSLTPLVKARIAELKGMPIYFYVDIINIDTLTRSEFKRVPKTCKEKHRTIRTTKNDYGKIYKPVIGNHDFSKEANDYYNYFYCLSRHDKDLVQAVEECGTGTDLCVVEIPDDVEYETHESECGGEWIAEKHRCWYAKEGD